MLSLYLKAQVSILTYYVSLSATVPLIRVIYFLINSCDQAYVTCHVVFDEHTFPVASSLFSNPSLSSTSLVLISTPLLVPILNPSMVSSSNIATPLVHLLPHMLHLVYPVVHL